MDRKIVSLPDHIGGRYHLQGTNIPVAMIRRDYADGENVLDLYACIDLTPGELGSILRFEFPELCNPGLMDDFIPWILTCSCGEETTIPQTEPSCQIVSCLCGRTWNVCGNPTRTEQTYKRLPTFANATYQQVAG